MPCAMTPLPRHFPTALLPAIFCFLFWSTPAHAGDCPVGIESIALEAASAPWNPSQDTSFPGGMQMRNPARFASALALEQPISSDDSGTWSTGERTWQLCLVGPTGTRSLTLIFGELALPLAANLTLTSNAGSKQVFTSYDGALFGGKVATRPFAGDAIVLTYLSDRASYSAPPSIRIDAVLQVPSDSLALPQNATSQLKTGPSLAAPPDDSLASAAQFELMAVNASNGQIGASMPCFRDAACYRAVKNATRATVLLLLLNENGGRVCTGTLVAGPNPADQLILTANHCREEDDDLTVATMWSVILDHGNECPVYDDTEGGSSSDFSGISGGAQWSDTLMASRRLLQNPNITSSMNNSSAALEFSLDSLVSTAQVVQGLEVIFEDEATDVMILRLHNEIPESLSHQYLGWDATGRNVASKGSAAVHHPLGDIKKVAFSAKAATPSRWRTDVKTHLLVNWGQHGGGTQDGSSGAALVDDVSGRAIGMLTGGSTVRNCTGNSDLFGSLAAAWEPAGLWKVLSPSGPDMVRFMPGRTQLLDGPGLDVVPPQVVVQERSEAREILQVSLSDPPLSTETISVEVSLMQDPTGGAPPVTLITSHLSFTAENWQRPHGVVVVPGNDSVADGPLPFQVIMIASSDLRTDYARRRVIKGLRTDDELLPGWSLGDPAMLQGSGGTIDAADLGLLAPKNVTGLSGKVKLGAPLVKADPLGTSTFYNLTVSRALTVDINACGSGSWMQVVVYNNSVARWSSTEPCASAINPACKSINNDTMCSGFSSLLLPSLGASLPPYTIGVSAIDGNETLFTFDLVQTSDQQKLFSSTGPPISELTHSRRRILRRP